MSSCWIRVAQVWAGARWGSMFIPRVGQEVIVEFLEGDPDRPIITGRLYNADNMPPYDLPTHKTQSGIKTRSSIGGDMNTFNELRFEDKKGAEQIVLHAERDWHTSVERNRVTSVGNDEVHNVHGALQVKVSEISSMAVTWRSWPRSRGRMSMSRGRRDLRRIRRPSDRLRGWWWRRSQRCLSSRACRIRWRFLTVRVAIHFMGWIFRDSVSEVRMSKKRNRYCATLT
jgi:hypothetical protein